MATSSGRETQAFEETISQLSIDVLLSGRFRKDCRDVLEFRMPQGSCKRVKKESPTFEFRLRLFHKFVDKWREQHGATINDANRSGFLDAWRKTQDEQERDCPEEELVISSPASIVEPLKSGYRKIEGVLVRKSHDRLCIIVIDSDGLPDVNELILPYNAEAFPGLGLTLKLGDIVRVFLTRNEGKNMFELEVSRHSAPNEDDVANFLSNLLQLNQNHAQEALSESYRCFAMWDHILGLEECSDHNTERILELCVSFCSKLTNTSKLMKQVAGSKFLSHVLPSLIEKREWIVWTDKCFMLLQDFLVFAVNSSPICAQKVANIANSLAKKVIDSSECPSTAKNAAVVVSKFQSRLLTAFAVKIPGVSSDLDSLKWSDLPLILTSGEIHGDATNTKLPVVKQSEQYESVDVYLDTYVRLMREECLYKLRTGIRDFVQDKYVDPRDIMMYRATFTGICTERDDLTPSHLSVELSLIPINETASEQLESQSSHWLMHGNLLCISLDGTYKEPVWALVEAVSNLGSKTVTVKFCSAKNPMSDVEIIGKLQELEGNDEEAYVAESSTFYAAFGPAIEVLQHKDHGVPFQEYLVDATGSTEPAEYIHNSITPDWSTIFETTSASLVENNPEYSIMEDLEKRMSGTLRAKLDATQLEAVKHALSSKVAVIQGPPGTGKTHVGVTLLRLLLSIKVEPILVVAYKNHALDDFLEQSLESIPSLEDDLARIPRPKDSQRASPKLIDCSLGRVAKTWSSRLFQRKMTVLSRVRSLQTQVRDCWNNLQLCKRTAFDVQTVIMEASSAQLSSLIGELAAGAEFQELICDHKADKSNLSQAQKDLIGKALMAWLPETKCFETFADRRISVPSKRKKRCSHEQESGGANRKDSSDDESPADVNDPLAVKEERLLNAHDETFEDDVGAFQRGEGRGPLRRTRPAVEINDFKRLLSEDNLNALSDEEKVGLVYVWQERYYNKHGRARYETLLREFEEVAKEYAEKYKEFEEVKHLHHVEVLKTRKVIGMTVDGAAMRAKLIADVKPRVMIVEEAAEILEPQLVAIIVSSVEHLILIGDHKQLQPTVINSKLGRKHHLNISLFERLINCGLPYATLGAQCRMREELAELVRTMKIYKEYKTNAELVRDIPEYVKDLPVMYFVQHTGYESDAPGTHSKRNVCEASRVSSCVSCLLSKGVPPSKVTVLCSYRGQVTEIKLRLTSEKFQVEVDTIDSFQGKENDIVIVSLVRSNPSSEIGFLKSSHRLCVAISRARFALYIFGNNATISASSRPWKAVVDYMRSKRYFGRKVPFNDTRTEALRSSGQLSLCHSPGSGEPGPLVTFPGHVMSILPSATPEEVVGQTIQRLQLQKEDLKEPNQEVVRKIRNFTRDLQNPERRDVIKHVRSIVPPGTTGPLLNEDLNVSSIPYETRGNFSIQLTVCDWKVVAEKMGLDTHKIRFLDERCRNPVDALLAHLSTSPRATIGCLYDAVVECGMPVVADLL